MRYLVLLLTIFAASFGGLAEPSTPQAGGKPKPVDAVSKAFQHAKPQNKNVLSIAGQRKKEKRPSSAEILAGLKDDDILLDIGGVFRLRWGLLRKHVEVLCMNIDRPDMQEAGNAALKKLTFQKYCRRLIRDYLEHGVFALEARRLGITVDEKEFQDYRHKAREGYARMGEVGEALTKLMESGESFYEHNLTNALYWKAYREKEIEPKIELPDADVRRFMGMRHASNLQVLATNDFKRALIGTVLAKVKGGMDFGEAAEKWSDDDSAGTNGVMMDEQGESTIKFTKDDLREEIAARCWGMKEGELSDVIETPYAWHIVKLLKRNPAKDDEEETIEFAQIKLEKEFIEPEFSEAEARDRARALILKTAMRAKFVELMKRTPIDTKLPLSDSGKRSESKVKIDAKK